VLTELSRDVVAIEGPAVTNVERGGGATHENQVGEGALDPPLSFEQALPFIRIHHVHILPTGASPATTCISPGGDVLDVVSGLRVAV
jgi:hypothetical protein